MLKSTLSLASSSLRITLSSSVLLMCWLQLGCADPVDPSPSPEVTPAPTLETPTPGFESPTPTGVTPTPGDETHTPGGPTATPGGPTATPGFDTPTPGGPTGTPGFDTPTPGGPTGTPGLDTPTPGGPTGTPGADTPTPDGTTDTPGAPTATPVDATPTPPPVRIDEDHDGYPTNPASGTPDCDDADPNTYPGAPELCDEVDNDCDGTIDDGTPDQDEDGIPDCSDDCPFDPDNDIDQDGFCAEEDNCPANPNPNQANTDGDSLGDVCDIETCDGIDNNGDGLSDEGFPDSDGDGLADCVDTCPQDASNDVDKDGLCANLDNCPTVSNPGQANTDGDSLGDACDTETCDGLDNNGDGSIDEGFPNQDGDALADCVDTCPQDAANDADADGLCANVDNCPTVSNPSQSNSDGDALGDACDAETCDGLDNDGDGKIDEGFDADGDGVVSCALPGKPADCDDTNAQTYPGATERCDNKDHNCDGVIDDGIDPDNDGIGACDEVLWVNMSTSTNSMSSTQATGDGSKEAADILRTAGFVITEVKATAITFSSSTLGPYNQVYILGRNDSNVTMSTTQADALEAWVKDGGRLMLMDGWGGTEKQVTDPIGTRFGMVHTSAGAWSGAATSFETHPVNTGISNVYYLGGAYWTISGPARTIQRSSNLATIAVAESTNGGRVLMVADEWMFYNAANGAYAIGYGDHKKQVTQIFQWLSEP